MAETIKAKPRRLREGWFAKYAPDHLSGIDIGWGGDPLNETFRRWDMNDGDASHMRGVSDAIFSTVYSSHCLEHLIDPLLGLRNWYRILKPGGHLIVVVPHRDLYEKRYTLPSRWNGDHKTMWLPDAEYPPQTLSLTAAIATIAAPEDDVLIRVLDEGYVANDPGTHAGGEYSIEAIVRKAMDPNLYEKLIGNGGSEEKFFTEGK